MMVFQQPMTGSVHKRTEPPHQLGEGRLTRDRADGLVLTGQVSVNQFRIWQVSHVDSLPNHSVLLHYTCRDNTFPRKKITEPC